MQINALGIDIGMKIGKKFSAYIPLPVKIIIGFIMILLLAVASYKIVSIHLHYKSLKNTADSIFEAEQIYFAKHGRFTADLKHLDIKLPPITRQDYSPSRYIHDNKESFYTPEIYSFQTKNDDSFIVQIINDLKQAEIPGAPSYSVLEISASGKFKSLRASYSISHYFGDNVKDIFPDETLKLCNINILDDKDVQRDIRLGAAFCKRMGAAPSNNELVWIF